MIKIKKKLFLLKKLKSLFLTNGLKFIKYYSEKVLKQLFKTERGDRFLRA